LNLRHIENVIDSIDPYNLIKDMGIPILDEQGNNDYSIKLSNGDKDKLIPSDLFGCNIRNKVIRILPNGFLNTRLYKDKDPISYYEDKIKEPFIAGTSIDFLSNYLGTSNELNYDEAFRLFFSYYSHYLKDKLYQEPSYIEKLVKPNFIKRQNVLRYIVKFLYLSDSYPNSTIMCKTWAARHNVQSMNGYGFYFTSKDVFNMLMYFNNNTLFDYYTQFTQESNSSKNPSLLKVDTNLAFSDFINNHLFSDSKEWVVIPYFSDFHIVSSLKFINPHDDTYYFIRLENDKLNFAGIYSMHPYTNFSATKIRVIETIEDAISMNNYAKRLTVDNKLIYLTIDYNPSGLNRKSNFNTWSKILFLHQQNSNFPLIRCLYDSLLNKNSTNSDLYICNYSNFKEDTISYTYESFVEKEFKRIISEAYSGLDKSTSMSTKLAIDLDYFMKACDIDNLQNVKKACLNWLQDNQFFSVYKKLTEIKPEKIEFKSYSITTTANGYICEYKDNTGQNISDKIAITNFLIKIDNNIMFPNNDDILHQGKLIMGDIEYPLSFYKSELKKQNDTIEQIALKAFAKTTSTIITDVQSESGYMLPVIFDPTFSNALYTIIKHEINHAPSKYGVSTIGWDKANNVFNSLSWQANALKVFYKKQYIYSLSLGAMRGLNKKINNDNLVNSDLQKCFSNLPLSKSKTPITLDKLSKNIKDILSVILSYLYRTYLGYETIPFIVNDNVYARNLIKFIFSALGQVEAYNVPPNTRLIKTGTLLSGINNYPIYLKCDQGSKEFLTQYNKNPYIILVKSTELQNINEPINSYNIKVKYIKDEYKQIAAFTQHTLDRFFKWLYTTGINDFDLENQKCSTQDQLIEEGNTIFRQLWSEKVYKQCDKESTPAEAFEYVIREMKLYHVTSCLNFYPENGCYVLKRAYLPEEAYNATVTLLQTLKKAGLGELLKEKDNTRCNNYLCINKEFVDKLLPTLKTLDGKTPDIVKDIKIFVSAPLALTYSKFGKPVRTIDRDELVRRCKYEVSYNKKEFISILDEFNNINS
jgi:hypothetical protein